MPLSENEQRILAEIEKHLQESDPRLAREVGRPPSFLIGRSLRSGVALTIAGTVAMVGTLQVHFLLAFVGFLIMTAGAVTIERSLNESGLPGRGRGRSSIAGTFRTVRPGFRRRNDR